MQTRRKARKRKKFFNLKFLYFLRLALRLYPIRGKSEKGREKEREREREREVLRVHMT
jgi:hypothetical protein